MSSIYYKVLLYWDVTLLARRRRADHLSAQTAHPLAALQTPTDDADRQQMPMSKTLLAH